MIYRVYTIASTYSTFHLDLTKLRSKFKGNGFPTFLVDMCVNSVLAKVYAEPAAKVPTVSKKPLICVLPFLGPTSYLVSRRLKTLIHKHYPCIDLKVVFKRGFRIKDLFSFKDRLPLSCRSSVIYYTQCKKCGPSAAYLGKTKNTIHERFYGSNGHLNPKTKQSALHSHLSESVDPECEFVFKDIEILGTSTHDIRLRYMESLMLKIGKKQTLNTQEWSIPLRIF